jgi:hypothetical protein
MANSVTHSRFNLGLRPATASSNSLFSTAKHTESTETRPPFPTVSSSKRCLCPLWLLILHSLGSPRAKSEIFVPLFSITCALFFTLCQRATRHLASFQSLPHSLPEYPGGRPTSPPKYAHQSASTRPAPRSRTERPTPPTRQANWIWSLLAIRYVFISSHRYFAPSPGETLSRALSS